MQPQLGPFVHVGCDCLLDFPPKGVSFIPCRYFGYSPHSWRSITVASAEHPSWVHLELCSDCAKHGENYTRSKTPGPGGASDPRIWGCSCRYLPWSGRISLHQEKMRQHQSLAYCASLGRGGCSDTSKTLGVWGTCGRSMVLQAARGQSSES